MDRSGDSTNGPAGSAWRAAPGLLLVFAMCAATGAALLATRSRAAESLSESRRGLERAVADYVGLYARPTIDRWKTLFHPSLVVTYPTEDGGVRARGLEEFFKAQKDYLGAGRDVSERLENVRIDEGWRIARVSADFVLFDEGRKSRGKLGLHLVETGSGWQITAIVFSYDRS